MYIREVLLQSDDFAEDYLSTLPIVQHLRAQQRLVFSKSVTFLVGENGTGKSTLLEAIALAYGFNPEGGTLNFSFRTRDTHAGLHRHLRLIKGGQRAQDGFFLRAESFYNVATYVEQVYEQELARGLDTPYGARSLHKQSHGESFLALIANRFSPNGLYLLDEPEAALSPMRQLQLMAHIDTLRKQGAQFVIATHAPMLMALPDAEVLALSEDGIAAVGYQDTEHVQLTRTFLDCPERIFRHLLQD